jgi:hypothetical protein
MSSDSPAIGGRSVATPIDGASPGAPTATRSPTNVAAITNSPAKFRWDLKTSRGRRCRDLFRSCLRLIGNPIEPTRQAQAIAAAESLVLAEIAREAALTDPSDRKIDVSIKVEKAARHALDALGIDKPNDKAPLSMADALRDRGYVPPVYEDDEAVVDDNEATTDDSEAST